MSTRTHLTRRPAFVVATVVAVLVLAGTGAGAAPSPALVSSGPLSRSVVAANGGPVGTPTTTTPPTPEDPHEIAAVSEAAALIVKAPTAASWTAVSSAPSSALSGPGLSPGGSDVITQTRFWTASGTWASVLAVVDKAPAGLTDEAGGSTSDHGVTTTSSVLYTAVTSPALIADLEITTAPISAGRIGIRADAQVVWIPTRARDEYASAGVDTAVMTIWNRGPRAWVHKVFTDAATVRKLRQAFNGLTVQNPGVFACPLDVGPSYGLRLTGPGLAPIVANSGQGCGGVSVVIGGRTMPELAGGSLTDVEANTVRTTTAALRELAMIVDGFAPPTQASGTPIHN